MKTFSASEAKSNIDSVFESALTEPVKIITERSAVVILNAAEYDRLLETLNHLPALQAVPQATSKSAAQTATSIAPETRQETETGGCSTPEELDRLIDKIDTATA